jgi:uncharacterized protein (TIGR02996 family)
MVRRRTHPSVDPSGVAPGARASLFTPAILAGVSGVHDEAALLRLLEVSDGADEHAELVYADWLQEHDDPRGALVVIQRQLAARPDDPSLRVAEQDLFARHRTALLGTLDDRTRVALRWGSGFIRRASIAGAGALDAAADVTALLAHPRCGASM